MTASRKTTNARTRNAAANATPAKAAPAKAANGKPATSTRASRKPAAASKTAKAAKPTARLSTDSDVIPTDPAELRKLIKITRDRRWRASRRGDAELVHAMNVKLEALTGKPFTPDEEPASKTAATKAPARKSTPAARKSTPARKTAPARRR